jgi:hypothetical protein
MPLKKGKSQKIISANISELMGKPGAARKKAVKTISNKQGISPAAAKQKQAIAIALSTAGKSKPKKA